MAVDPNKPIPGAVTDGSTTFLGMQPIQMQRSKEPYHGPPPQFHSTKRQPPESFTKASRETEERAPETAKAVRGKTSGESGKTASLGTEGRIGVTGDVSVNDAPDVAAPELLTATPYGGLGGSDSGLGPVPQGGAIGGGMYL